MGIFNKAKAFVGGKGMADVAITVIERQPAERATFPVTDSVIKGTMVITARQACTLLATRYELYLRMPGESGNEVDQFVTSAQDPAPNTHYGDSCLKLPCDLSPGQVITQPWLVMDVDLVKAFKSRGYPSVDKVIDNARIKFVVKCIADMKGSPFDPSAEVVVRLVR